MNTNINQQNTENATFNLNSHKISKRKREDNMDENKAIKKEAKSLFRPWCDDKQNKVKSLATNIPSKATGILTDSKLSFDLPFAPVIVSPYYLAMQHQTSLALQQAMYQRQYFMDYYRVQQQQYQQLMIHQQAQHLRQQLFLHNQQYRQ